MKKLLFLMFTTSLLFASCGGDNGEENPSNSTKARISIAPSSLTFDTAGGTQSIVVTSSNSWSLSGGESWCSPSITSGNDGDVIGFNIQANSTLDERNATYTLACGSKTVKLVITQKQKDALTVTSSKFEVPSSGEDILIEIKANIDFQYEIGQNCKDWITPIATRAMQTSHLNFKIDSNESINKREGTIVISSGELSETININQTGAAPSLTINQYSYEVSADGEEIKIELNTNIDYSVQMPYGINWITESATTRSSHAHFYEISKNNTLSSREAKIAFYNNSQGIREEVKILQLANSVENLLQTVNVETKGTLNSVLTEKGLTNVIYLKITGVLNDVDFVTLYNMPSLRHLDISEINITTLPNRAFYQSSNVQTVILPETLTEIGKDMFRSSSIRVVSIGSNTLSIGDYAFYYCQRLTSIEIPANVETIGYSAFENCELLTSINIPNKVQTIGQYAFESCISLSAVDFQKKSTLKNIEFGAFSGCTALMSIEIPASVEILKSNAFSNCTSLISVTFEKGTQLKEIVGKGSTGGNTITSGTFLNCTALKSFEIPASIVSIQEAAFYNCTSLSSLAFEKNSNLKEIGGLYNYGAFRGCIALTSLEIPASVESLGQSAFAGCSQLKTVIFQEGSRLQIINGGGESYGYYGAFSDCRNLATVDASACTNLASIGNFSFYRTSISLLKIGAEIPPSFILYGTYNYVFSTTANAVLKVPDGSVNAYQAWKTSFPNISGLNE